MVYGRNVVHRHVASWPRTVAPTRFGRPTAHDIGPIAKAFVEKTASEAHTPDEFCDRLATHVTAPADRMAFL